MKNLKDDEAAIRTLMAKFAADFNSGDIEAIMTNYVSDESLIIFDLVPRKDYRGAGTYRENWVEMFSHFKGKPKISIAGLGIYVDGNVGFGYSFQQITGTDKHGIPINRAVRVTDGYRKVGGNWRIALEHVSVPVDLKSGKADFSPKL